jgi:threonine efflux protein
MAWDLFGVMIEPAHLALVYSAYFLGAASPGPSNLAIMNVAMSRGRAPAVATAIGVLGGAMCWALLAATGLTAVLTSFAYSLIILKTVGGCYLLYLAFKSARSALRINAAAQDDTNVPANASRFHYFRAGVMLHASNPKAILTWVATMSLGLSANSSPMMLALIIAGCFFIGLGVFVGYALLFSTASMNHIYLRLRRWFDGALAMLFGYAGIKLLASRT